MALQQKKADLDALEREYEQEFRDRASDLLNELEDLITRGHDEPQNAKSILDQMFRRAHSLKGMGGMFGHPLVTLIAHRFEDSLNGVDALSTALLHDAQKFADHIADAVAGRYDGIKEADIVRQLPGKRSFDLSDVAKQDIEVLLIMPRDTSQRIVEREIQACGYRISTVSAPFEGMEFAIRTRPNLVIAARVLDYVTGIDVICGIKAMPESRDIPCVLVTSDSIDEVRRAGLPEAVPVVRKGEQFGEDFAQALEDIHLT